MKSPIGIRVVGVKEGIFATEHQNGMNSPRILVESAQHGIYKNAELALLELDHNGLL